MKQKVIIKVALNDKKARKKVITTAVGIDGVTKADLVHEKNQIEVIGDEIDIVLLANRLRKVMKHAEIVSVSPVDDKKVETKEETKPNTQLMLANNQIWPHQFYTQIPVHDHSYAYANYHDSPSCSIM